MSGIPSRPPTLLGAGGKLFVKSRPQYEMYSSGEFLSATTFGIANDGISDQSVKINEFLAAAKAANQIAYFPAGIYLVEDTIVIPVDSRVQGTSWSQVSTYPAL